MLVDTRFAEALAHDDGALYGEEMGTRRWLEELERWIWTKKLTKEDVARRSGHDVGHVLDLFTLPNPNPTLRLYLDLLEAAGARMDTANGNTVGHVVSRIGELRNRAGLSVSELARRSGVGRTHLSGIINGSKTNMQLGIFDVLVTTLGAEEEMRLVERYHNSQLVRLALAAGAETVAADGPARPHLHAVPNPGANPPRSSGPAQTTIGARSVDPSSASGATDPPGWAPRSQAPNDGERRAAAERAAAERAAAEQVAQEKARADEAEARAAQEGLRAEQEKARAEQESARAKAAAEEAAQVAARAELSDRLLIAGGLTMMVFGGVMVYKGLSSDLA